MLVSKAKFLTYQNQFYSKIQRTPYKIQLEVVVPEKKPSGFSADFSSAFSDGFDMDAFVGDSKRESKLYTLRCLYEKDISERTREKYGLPKEVNGVVYLSPKQLKPLFGDYHLDWNKTKVHFEGSVQVINKVVYLEEFVEYGTCIGVQIFLKDALRGG